MDGSIKESFSKLFINFKINSIKTFKMFPFKTIDKIRKKRSV
jgi:hypothetical protein